MYIIKIRKLSKHPSYKKDPVPCILIAGREIAKKYGWKVGDLVNVILEDDGVKITKPLVNLTEVKLEEALAEAEEIQEETTSLEEKEEKLEKSKK